MVNFRVEIDHMVCQGFGACIELCSKFKLGEDDAKSHVEGAKKTKNGEEVEIEQLDCHQKAAEACPYNAIHIIKLDTNEKII